MHYTAKTSESHKENVFNRINPKRKRRITPNGRE